MSLEAERRLMLQQRKLELVRRKVAGQAYLTVRDIQTRLGLSRETVEALPLELLPFVDLGLRKKSMRRYHPDDVMALDARFRAWQAARSRGQGEAYLSRLKEELRERDRETLDRSRRTSDMEALG